MSEQAKNFMDVCKGGSVGTIHGLLHLQSQAIRDELMSYFKTDSYEELAFKLSVGE